MSDTKSGPVATPRERRSWSQRIGWKRAVLYTVGLAAVAVAVWGAAQGRRTRSNASPESARRHGRGIPVRTYLVSDTATDTVIGATAVTAASKAVPVRFHEDTRLDRFSAAIRVVHVHDGDRVNAGDVLYEVDDTRFQQDLTRANQALAAAEAELAHASTAVKENAVTRQVEAEAAAAELDFRKTDVDYRKLDYERLKDLHDREVASLVEYLEAASAYAEARYRLTLATQRDSVAKAELVLGPLSDQIDVEKANAVIEEARLEAAVSADKLERCKLRSPIAGYADKTTGVEGLLVDSTLVLAQVLQTDPIHVQLDFPQERADELAVGQMVEVVLDSFPKETFNGTVLRIPVRAVTESRTLPVIVEVPNPENRIKVGVSGFARVHVPVKAATVPAVAVIDLDPEAMVFVVENGQAHLRSVRTGPVLEPGIRVVDEGLAAGDEVVIYGQQYLRDGEPVNADWRQWACRD